MLTLSILSFMLTLSSLLMDLKRGVCNTQYVYPPEPKSCEAWRFLARTRKERTPHMNTVMTHTCPRINTILLSLFIFALAPNLLYPMELNLNSTKINSTINGGFETVSAGQPAHWILYNASNHPKSNYEIKLDTENFKEGKQSLRFDVASCSPLGGNLSPGFTSEFFQAGKLQGPGTYTISFWVMNDGAEFRVRSGGVSTKKGKMLTLIESAETHPNWQYYEYKVNVPAKNWMRFEVNVLSPGTFWIDDIRIEKTADRN